MSGFVVLLGAGLGAGLLWASWMRRWLTASGVVTAALVGLALAAGLGGPGLALLVFFFVSSSALTRRRARAGTGVEAGARAGRTGSQVLANGAIATAAALAAALDAWPPEPAALAASGSLAAATADTWATEIGERLARNTRLVTTWRRVAPGTNGAVSWPGTLAGLTGALVMGGLAAIAFADRAWVVPVAAAGVGGMAVDSVLGATLEGRRPWLGNDAVNWAGTCSGALLALILA